MTAARACPSAPQNTAAPCLTALGTRRQLHSLISQARNLTSTMDANWPIFLKEARDLGIKPEYPREWPDFTPYIARSDLCKPLLKTG